MELRRLRWRRWRSRVLAFHDRVGFLSTFQAAAVLNLIAKKDVTGGMGGARSERRSTLGGCDLAKTKKRILNADVDWARMLQSPATHCSRTFGWFRNDGEFGRKTNIEVLGLQSWWSGSPFFFRWPTQCGSANSMDSNLGWIFPAGGGVFPICNVAFLGGLAAKKKRFGVRFADEPGPSDAPVGQESPSRQYSHRPNCQQAQGTGLMTFRDSSIAFVVLGDFRSKSDRA